MTADYKAVKRQVERKRQEEGMSAEEEEVERNRDHNDLTSFPIEHARLRSLRTSRSSVSLVRPRTDAFSLVAMWFVALIAATITYGWLVEYGVHLSAPLIMQFISALSVHSPPNLSR